jgi:hypothetical protein
MEMMAGRGTLEQNSLSAQLAEDALRYLAPNYGIGIYALPRVRDAGW